MEIPPFGQDQGTPGESSTNPQGSLPAFVQVFFHDSRLVLHTAGLPSGEGHVSPFCCQRIRKATIGYTDAQARGRLLADVLDSGSRNQTWLDRSDAEPAEDRM